MSLQDLSSNYPEGHPGECMHGMPDDGLDCIQCAQLRAVGHLDELQDLADYLNEEKDKNGADNRLVEDNIDDLEILTKSLRTFVNRINPEIESWKRVTTQLTHEKAVAETRCEYYEKGLRLIVEKCVECPDTAQFACALLDGTVQLHTESVVSWDKDCDECHGMGFIKGWIYNNNREIPCPKCNKNWSENNGKK